MYSEPTLKQGNQGSKSGKSHGNVTENDFPDLADTANHNDFDHFPLVICIYCRLSWQRHALAGIDACLINL